MKRTFVCAVCLTLWFVNSLADSNSSDSSVGNEEIFDQLWVDDNSSWVRYPVGDMELLHNACLPSSSEEVKLLYQTIASAERLLAGYIPQPQHRDYSSSTFISCTKVAFIIQEDGTPVAPKIISSWETSSKMFPGYFEGSVRRKNHKTGSEETSWMKGEFMFNEGERRRGLLILYGFANEMQEIRRNFGETAVSHPAWTLDGSVDRSYRRPRK